jgi:hypothetical protein
MLNTRERKYISGPQQQQQERSNGFMIAAAHLRETQQKESDIRFLPPANA